MNTLKKDLLLFNPVTKYRETFDPLTPPITGNLAVFLAADSITTLNDGDPVETWPDLSGNNRNATQDTLANRPLWRNVANGIGGRPALQLDGTGDGMRIAYNTASALSIYWVQFTTDTAYLILSGSSPGSQFSWVAQSENTSTAVYQFFGTPTPYVDGVDPNWTTRASIYTTLNNKPSIVTSINAGINAWIYVDIGRYQAPFGYAGLLSTLLIYEAVHTETQRQQVEAWLKQKYNI